MSRLKTFCVVGFITAYVGALTFGVVGHALKVGICGNTLSYFVVWDMFCGWSAWDQRTHVIAEGVSGKYYDLKEPWGEFHPFGNTSRVHYDHTNHMLPKHIRNVLDHTAHEDINQVFMVQEVWPKQYNLPPRLYEKYFQRENDKVSYFHLRAVLSDDGKPLKMFPDWFVQQELNSINDNPRLQQQASRALSVYSTLHTPVTSGNSAGSILSTN